MCVLQYSIGQMWEISHWKLQVFKIIEYKLLFVGEKHFNKGGATYVKPLWVGWSLMKFIIARCMKLNFDFNFNFIFWQHTPMKNQKKQRHHLVKLVFDYSSKYLERYVILNDGCT
jgi:hypothetical protein